MGYGGIFKTVAKIAVTYVGFTLGGPLGAAVASSAFTAATGGSFKEALISGATSYIGARISVGLNESIGSAAANANFSDFTPTTFIDSAGTTIVNPGELIPAGFAGANTELGGSLFGGAITEGLGSAAQELVNQPIGGGISDALKGITDPFATATSSVGSVYSSINNDLLGGLLPKFTEGFAVKNAGNLLASMVGGIASLTLEQALNAELPGLDEALMDEGGFNPQSIQFLRQEARNAMSQGAFDRLTGPEGATNPFGTDEAGLEEFRKVIAAGIERENTALGPDITEAQFNTAFDDPFIGQSILSGEEDLRKQTFNQQIGTAFPGNAFTALDDDIINSIVSERQGPAQQQISRFGARGNLNPTGGLTANQFIQRQVPEAQERVREISAGVLGGGQRDVNVIRERAREQAGGYKLGEDLFDVTPFSEERRGLVEERQGTLGSDVRSAIGSDPLFDVSGALRSAGRAQGVVSGQGQNQSFLDSIAAREGISANRTRRGLGSRGSGAF